MNLADCSAAELTAAYGAGTTSPVEALQAVLDRAGQVNPVLNCLMATDADGAMVAARESEARWNNGAPLSPLDGVPVTVKDLLLTAGMPTMYGSLTVEEDQPCDEDAPVTAHLRRAGAVIFAKTTTPEFGHKGTTESLLHGISRNPWNTDLTPGGSSGGAAAAVASGIGPIAIGTDGGGSIRQPANFCGVVGFKPSAMAIPIWPHAGSWPISVNGPMARSVADAAACFSVVARPDDRDPWAGRQPADLYAPLADLHGMRVAIATSLGESAPRAAIQGAVERVAAICANLGASVHEGAPDIGNALPVFRTMWDVGSAWVMSTIPEERRGLLEESYLGSALRGEAISQVEYRQALADRLTIQKNMGAFYREYDLLLLAVNPFSAYPVERLEPERIDGDAWKTGIAFTCPFNLTGQPAVSLPVSLVDGVPVGVQLVGPYWSDSRLLAIAGAIEGALDWKQRLAPLPG